MIGGTRNRKGEYQWCGNELYDWNCNLKRYSWQLTVWEKQKIIQALQYNSITVSINHIFALGSENVTRITWMTRIFICKFPPFLISHRYSGAAKTEWKLGFTLLSRVRISQRQITEIYYPRNTENTEKIKVKETLWGRCSSAFSSLIYLLWYALGLYYQERIIKKLCEVGNKNIYNKVK